MNQIKVLDHGHVDYINHMGSDLTVVNSARVSFAKEASEFKDQDERLVKYLAEHKHWTPFAHPQITLRIKAPISIARQLFKHKVGFTENEVSRRYVRSFPEFYTPEWRAAPTGGAKQGSCGLLEDQDDKAYFDADYDSLMRYAESLYDHMIMAGVAPEQARFCLPQSMFTEWFWTGSLSAYARVWQQRSDPHAQWEVQQYADAFQTIIEPLFPVSWKYLTGDRNADS